MDSGFSARISLFSTSLVNNGRALLRNSFFSLCLLLLTAPTWATPPNYVSLGRQQAINPVIDDDDLLRIWMIFVGQGDGILIELPSEYDTTRFDDQSGNQVVERTNVLIDAGSFRGSNADRATEFINRLYPTGAVIEHAVISHHDSDHVQGFTELLEDPSIEVEAVYHNGLASYLPGRTIDTNVNAFPSASCPSSSVCKSGNDGVTRAIGMIDSNNVIRSGYLIDDLAALSRRRAAGVLQGVYDRLADALLEDARPTPISSFERVPSSPNSLIDGPTASANAEGLCAGNLKLWPENVDKLRPSDSGVM